MKVQNKIVFSSYVYAYVGLEMEVTFTLQCYGFDFCDLKRNTGNVSRLLQI